MHELVFYEDIKGKSEVLDYIEYLSKRSKEEKDSRILYCKIVAYLNMLEEYGTRLPKKIAKHLQDDIWELRPLKIRILFAHCKNGKYIILHYFIKKTAKTPKRELLQAIYNFKNYQERDDKE